MAKAKARPKFITFEGTEGAGKSTLIQSLQKALQKRGISTITTREPGGVEVAERIRKILLENPMSPWTELFLYEAARAEHLYEVILPGLTQGHWVLCDRFTDSTLAYQGQARGLPWKDITVLNRLATRGLSPDHVIWIDIDPALGLSHAQDPNRFEAEGVRFQKKVRSGFAKAMKLDQRKHPKKWIRIQARSGSPEDMAQKVLSRILR